jgi:hypothetical protein
MLAQGMTISQYYTGIVKLMLVILAAEGIAIAPLLRYSLRVPNRLLIATGKEQPV